MINICGRYNALSEDEIVEIREIIQNISLQIAQDGLTEYAKTGEEVCPTENAPVITRQGDGIVALESQRWGFKKWDGKGVIINARSESLQTKSMFEGLLTTGRCVVPANHFYEWERRGKERVKHFIKDKEGNLLFMAGLYREGEDGREFVIITKDAYGDVVHIHDRMPVILRADQIEQWLSGALSPDDIVELNVNMAVEPCVVESIQLNLFECQ